MGLFNSRRLSPPAAGTGPPATIPLSQIDLTKRYDVYTSVSGEERLYEDVLFLGLRTFERISEYSSGLGGYVEIETRDGSRLLIPYYGIQLLCEHGTRPAYKVLRRWGNTVDY